MALMTVVFLDESITFTVESVEAGTLLGDLRNFVLSKKGKSNPLSNHKLLLFELLE